MYDPEPFQAIDTIVAGILHDVIDDACENLSSIEEEFGCDVAKLVAGVSRLCYINQHPFLATVIFIPNVKESGLPSGKVGPTSRGCVENFISMSLLGFYIRNNLILMHKPPLSALLKALKGKEVSQVRYDSVTDWSLELKEVYLLDREGEFDKFVTYRQKLKNRMLLWHDLFRKWQEQSLLYYHNARLNNQKKKKMMSSGSTLQPVKEMLQSSMVKRIKKRTTTRKLQPQAELFSLPKNTIVKQINASDIEKLKQIFEEEGNAALIWGGEGIHAVSYEDIIAVLNRGEVSSNVIDCYAELLYTEQTEIQNQLTTVHQKGVVNQEKSYFVTSLCWKFVTVKTPEMREKILHPQISPSRTANHRFVHFLMNSNGKRKDAEPFHWTLLVLDQKEGDWLHYNSLRPRSAKIVDHYFDDARTLKQYVENYNFLNVEDTQPYGAPLLSVEDATQPKMGSKLHINK